MAAPALCARGAATPLLGGTVMRVSQPRTDPRKGPPGANLFLRKDAKDGSFVVQAAAGDEEQGGGG